MTQPRLSTQALLELLALFDQSITPILDAEGNRIWGVPGWTLPRSMALDRKELQAWTVCTGYAGSIGAPFGDEIVPVDLVESDEPDIYEYSCPETYRTRQVGADQAAVLEVDSIQLLNELADLLNIAQVKRGGIQAPRIDRILWCLGDARVGPAMTPVWIVRGLATHVDQIYSSLLDTRLPAQGLILSAGHELPSIIRSPRHYRVAYMRHALVDYAPSPCLDLHYLERVLTSSEDGIRPSALPVDFTNGVLRIRTKPHAWVVNGDRQKRAIDYMYAEAQEGRWELDASSILAAAYPDRPEPEDRTGLRVQDLFKHNERWREFIANPRKGAYGFNLG